MAIPRWDELIRPVLELACKGEISRRSVSETIPGIIEHNIGVSVSRRVDLKRVDSDYFGE